MALSLFALLGVLPGAVAAAERWSFTPTLVVAPLVLPEHRSSGNVTRFGIDARVERRFSKWCAIGVETGGWVLTGNIDIAYAVEEGPEPPINPWQWNVPFLATGRLEATVLAAHPYVSLAAGDLVTVHQSRNLDAIVEHAAAFGAGAGIRGSGRPAPLLEARWLHALSNPYESAVYEILPPAWFPSRTSDYVMVSGGIHFH